MQALTIDAHAHLVSHEGISKILEVAQNAGFERINLVCSTGTPERSLDCNSAAMLAKALHPRTVYVFGGLHYRAGEPATAADLVRQAKELWLAGCDGVKMLEGKPTTRKRVPYRMDDPIYDEYYAFLQEQGIPIIWHVADPASFWDPERVSASARQQGWDYSDGSFPSREQLYGEVDHVLGRFPKLRVVFAHFYFLSDEPERAEAFLARWPNVSFDITPGAEMYRNFSKCPERWHTFFTTFGDRIIFGTDNVAPREPWNDARQGMLDKVGMMRRFLECGERFEGFCTATSRYVTGLGLEADLLARIYRLNFEKLVGAVPRKLNIAGALQQCQRVAAFAQSDSRYASLLREANEIENRLLEAQRGAPRT